MSLFSSKRSITSENFSWEGKLKKKSILKETLSLKEFYPFGTTSSAKAWSHQRASSLPRRSHQYVHQAISHHFGLTWRTADGSPSLLVYAEIGKSQSCAEPHNQLLSVNTSFRYFMIAVPRLPESCHILSLWTNCSAKTNLSLECSGFQT